MSLRLATSGDFPSIKALLLEIQRIHAEALPQVFKAPDPDKITAERYQQVISHPQKQILVALAEEQVVGYVYAEVIQSKGDLFHQPRSWVYVHQIGVEAEFRGQGYAQALLEQVVEFARNRGVDRVEIEVWGFNQPARSVYEKLGFTLQSQRLCLQLEPTQIPQIPSDPI